MAARTTRSRAAKSLKGDPPPDVKDEPQQLSSPPATPAPETKAVTKKKAPKAKAAPTPKSDPITPNSSRKRTRAALKEEDKAESDELPHNLGSFNPDELPTEAVKASAKKRARTSRNAEPAPIKLDDPDVLAMAEKVATPAKKTPSKKAKSPKDPSAKREKNINYGLTPGQTPYPDWPHPTPEECYEVNRILSKAHGEVKAPATIPTPSLTVSGCGEVPSVLDALIRTRLSAATSGANSSRAFKGLVERFGILTSGVGKGSVDWNAVRRADVKEVFEAIKSGGLADVKSRDIKAILQIVYEENQARGAALAAASSSANNEDADKKAPAGASNESVAEKRDEIARADENVLSLDHLHLLSSSEAFDALIKYPGIGPKTASCVLLFCLQRPSFAVDTHVFRLCRWLGWVPRDKATRNSTYAHCEVRVPDELKYPLHQLLIRHGKNCPRCRANTGPGSKEWERGCPIEHLVVRDGRKVGGGGKGKKGKGREGESEGEAEEGSSGLGDLGSEEEVSEGEESQSS